MRIDHYTKLKAVIIESHDDVWGDSFVDVRPWNEESNMMSSRVPESARVRESRQSCIFRWLGL